MLHPPTMVEMMLILGIALLIFGTGKLRNIGKDLGTAVKEFRNVFSDKPENKDGGSSSAS